jgi:hypothetical protein
MGVKHAVAVLKSEFHGMKKSQPSGPWIVSLDSCHHVGSVWYWFTDKPRKMGNNDAKLQRYHSMTFRKSQAWNPRLLAVTMGCSIKSGQCFPPAKE